MGYQRREGAHFPRDIREEKELMSHGISEKRRSSCPTGYHIRGGANILWDIGDRELYLLGVEKKCEKFISHGISEKGRSSCPPGYHIRGGANILWDIRERELMSVAKKV